MRTETLVVGAGVSGLAFAAALGDADFVLVDAADEVGGYCRTVHRDGFVWDYAGHFFHFRHPEIEDWLIRRIGPSRVRKVARRSKVLYKGRLIDFPFQHHIHQLAQDEFIDCLNGLGTRDTAEPQDFEQLLRARYGAAIAEKFLVPYNEKLYADRPRSPWTSTPWAGSSRTPTWTRILAGHEAAGTAEVQRHLHLSARAAPSSTSRPWPAPSVPPGRILLEEPLAGDRRAPPGRPHHATHYRVRAAGLLGAAAEPAPPSPGCPTIPAVFTWNKVLVFNLGFDRKGPSDVHWIYYPDRDGASTGSASTTTSSPSDRMSLYVEIGCLPTSRSPGRRRRDPRARAGGPGARGHRRPTTSWWRRTTSVLDPAYVHITRASLADAAAQRGRAAPLAASTRIGRYGGWTYCSIEDNIVEARALAQALGGCAS